MLLLQGLPRLNRTSSSQEGSGVMRAFSTCHPERSAKGLGLCEACYRQQYDRRRYKDPAQVERRRIRNRAAKKRWKLKYPDKWKAEKARAKVLARSKPGYYRKMLYQRHGITLAIYESMYAAQSGCCAICGIHRIRLHVDHDHHSRKIRQLLCSPCNTGIGLFREDPVRLEQAIEYLITHGKGVAA